MQLLLLYHELTKWEVCVMENMYITANELAEMLHLTRGSVYTMRRKGILPEGKKIGGVRRWSAKEIQEFMKAWKEQWTQWRMKREKL